MSLIFVPRLIDFVSHVGFKKLPCHPVVFKGQGPYASKSGPLGVPESYPATKDTRHCDGNIFVEPRVYGVIRVLRRRLSQEGCSRIGWHVCVIQVNLVYTVYRIGSERIFFFLELLFCSPAYRVFC